METARPNPFVSQNGSDLWPANGQHRAAEFDDNEDFGPETDVDVVDDVLLSPAIAAAKALVQGKKEIEDDLERQRQQLSDFDDPADIERSRDTPTPPAHEVAGSANADTLGESGGEESEEEWNYIPGKDTKPDCDTQEEDDMSSQLNPNAAEFVPVSPSRLMMMDNAIISATSYEKPMDNVVSSEGKFDSEISHHLGDREFANGPKQGDDYFMRDNFSNIPNKKKDFTVSSTTAELGEESIMSFDSTVKSLTACAPGEIPFDKLDAVQNMEENVTSCVLGKENIFGTNIDFSSQASGVTNIFGESGQMTATVIGLKGFASSPEQEENLILGSPKSATVEAPISPTNDNTSPSIHQTELDSPADDYVIHAQKSPDLISPGDGPQDGLISGQERTSSSGFESESGAEEGVPEESSEGFITEHRKSPPIDLSFKTIQTFSDTNPFGALQTPTSTTPMDQNDQESSVEHGESHFETPKKNNVEDKPTDNMDLLQNTPSSFISLRRSPTEEKSVPFDELESPKDSLHFEQLPIANSSFLASELPKSPVGQTYPEEIVSSIKKEPFELDFENRSMNVTESSISDITQHISPVKTDSEFQETSFTTDNSQSGENVSTKSHLDLDTTAGFLIEESKIQQEEQASEQNISVKSLVDLDSNEGILVEESKIVQDGHECEQIFKQVGGIKVDSSNNFDVVKEVKTDNSELAQPVGKEIEREFDIREVLHLPEFKETKVGAVELSQPENNEETKVDAPVISQQAEEDSVLSDTSPLAVEQVLAAFDEIKDDLEVVGRIKSQVEEKESDFELETKEMKLEFESHIAISEASPEDLKNLDDDFEVISKDELTVEDNILNTSHNELKEIETNLQDVKPASVKETPTTLENVDLVSSSEHTNDFVNNDNIALTPENKHLHTPVEETKEKSLTVGNNLSSVIDNFSSALNEELITSEQSTLLASAPELSSPLEPHATKTVSYQTLTPADEPKLTKTETYVTGIDEHVPEKSPIQVQSQVVTETLITTLEETTEVPSVTTAEVSSSAGTPPPTPALGIDSKDDSQKTDILVAAVAVAGTVAAGSALVAEKEVKKAITSSTTKKPSSGAPKKPESSAKAPAKPAPGKVPAAKSGPSKTTTTKPASLATKQTGTTTSTKPPTTKPASASSVAPKKPAAPKTATGTATATATAKPTTIAPPKPVASLTTKSVPKQLPVNKTSASTLKTSSKPTTPTSNKPTTPTTPKSPSVKSEVKSPPRLAARTTKTLVGTGDKPTEKKPLTNGEIKPLAKKEDLVKKPATTKPSPITRPPAVTKTTAPSGKPVASTLTKTTTTKVAQSVPPKPKPTATAKPDTTAPVKKSSLTTGTKITDKTGKEAVNKQISNTKPATNGKAAPTKGTVVKKTDAKGSVKTSTDKPPPIKKIEEIKKDEEKKPTQIQEDNITTTNGFAEHIIEENESIKIEELAPVIVDGVN